MRIALFTQMSPEINTMAGLTVPNKYEYCSRHGYSLIVNNQPYDDIVAGMDQLINLLNIYDILWTLDSDLLITNMTMKIEQLDCLGPHMTVCEEGIVPWNKINCGSMVWKNTEKSKGLLKAISENKKSWDIKGWCGWQTWLWTIREQLGDTMTVAPVSSFNSCTWNNPGGNLGEPGTNWKPGDFVCHACGVFPYEPVRRQYLELIEEEIVR